MQKSNCTVTGCNSKHHTLFHTYRNTKEPCNSLDTKNEKRNNSDNVEPQSLSKNTYATGAGDRMCLKVIPVTIGNKVTHKKVETYALLDNCSDVTLCSDRLVSELMLDGEKTEYSL